MNSRQIATSSVIGVFFVTALTGLLMFLDIGSASVRATHEWISVLFMCAAFYHVFIHKRSFMRYLKEKTVVFSGLGLVIAGVLFSQSYDDLYAADASFDLLVNVKVETLATLVDEDVSVVVGTLKKAGASEATPAMTIEEIARGGNVDVYDLIEPLLERANNKLGR